MKRMLVLYVVFPEAVGFREPQKRLAEHFIRHLESGEGGW